MYNHQIPSLTQLIETKSFTTSWYVDRYLIDAPLGHPVTITLGEKGLCDGDQFTLIDVGCNAQTQPITIEASGTATILSTGGSSTRINSNCGGMRLTYNQSLNSWYPEELVPGGSMGEAFLQGGNSFGMPATLGTLDDNSLKFITNGTARFQMPAGENQFQSFGLGTASFPVYTFEPDPGTGMYQPSTGVLGFSFEGNSGLTLDMPSAGLTNVDAPGTLAFGSVSATAVQIGGAGATPTFPDNLQVASSIDTIAMDAPLLEIGTVRAAAIQLGEVNGTGTSTFVGICTSNPLASLHIGGSLIFNTPTSYITTSYTVDTGASPASGPDLAVITDSTAGILTITLPASPEAGRVIIVGDGTGEASTHHVTISGNGLNINGAATQTLSNAWGSYTLMFIESGPHASWMILAKN